MAQIGCLRPKPSLEKIDCRYGYFDHPLSGELDDNSASICPAQYPLPDSPMLPHGDSKNIAVEQHGERFLAVANEEVNVRVKRPHENDGDNDLGNPAKRARVVDRFKGLCLDNLYGDICEDRDTMILEVVADLERMQREIDTLKAQLHCRKKEEDRQKAHIVANWIRRGGRKREEYGDILISPANGNQV